MTRHILAGAALVIAVAAASPCAAQEAPLPVARDTSRFDDFIHDATKPFTLARPVVMAVYDQARDSPDGWNGDSDGMGRRLAARGGQAAISLTVRHGVAAMLGVPAHPVHCATATGGARMVEAAVEAVADRACSGAIRPSVPRITARLASGFAPLMWHQPDFTAGKAARGFAIGIATSALMHMAVAAIKQH